jgi:hypothetical protein
MKRRRTCWTQISVESVALVTSFFNSSVNDDDGSSHKRQTMCMYACYLYSSRCATPNQIMRNTKRFCFLLDSPKGRQIPVDNTVWLFSSFFVFKTKKERAHTKRTKNSPCGGYNVQFFVQQLEKMSVFFWTSGAGKRAHTTHKKRPTKKKCSFDQVMETRSPLKRPTTSKRRRKTKRSVAVRFVSVASKRFEILAFIINK